MGPIRHMGLMVPQQGPNLSVPLCTFARDHTPDALALTPRTVVS
jgi:hypothetical protein